MNIIGYSYDAAIHCVSCTIHRFGLDLEDESIEDSEGNPIHPVFSTDELEKNETCDTCHAPIE